MPRDVTVKEAQHLLGIPEMHVRNGVMCIGLPNGEILRITSYVSWFRFEHISIDERDQCMKEME